MLGEMDVEVQPGRREHLCVSGSIPRCGTSHAKRVDCRELHLWKS